MTNSGDELSRSIPHEIGSYRLLDLLGEGASALVFRACLADDPNQKVAVKLSKTPWNEADIETRVRFEQEAELLNRLTHPNIVRLLKLGVHAGHLYLVTELATGKPLNAVIDSGSGLNVEIVANILEQLGRGLAHAHSRGVLHRDIKPSNIVVDFSNRDVSVKLLDFGLGRLQERAGKTNAIGTFLYMSPEQLGILPQMADERSDLYSLGIVAAEMLARRHPFAGQDLRELIHSHAAVLPVIPPETPPGLAQIVMALVQKDPAKRYGNADLLEKDVARFRANLRQGIGDVFPLTLRQRGLSLHPPGFTGRRDGLAVLENLHASAATGELAVGLVSGFSGYGKSRLLSEASRGWSRSVVLWGKGRAYGQTSAYGVAAEVLRGLAAEPLSEEMRKRIRDAVGERAGDLVRLVPELRALVGDPKVAIDLDPERRQQRFVGVVLDLLAALGTKGAPLVIGLDDVQWADEGSLQLFSQLVAGKTFPVLLLAGYRVDEISEGGLAHEFLNTLGRTPCVHRIELGPLETADVAAIVESMLGEPHPEVAQVIAAQAGGSPLFTIELLHALVESGAILGTAQGWKVVDEQKLTESRYSDTLMQTIVQRINRLPDREKEVLRLAAVLGQPFRFQHLAAALRHLEPELDQEATALVHRSLREAEKIRLVTAQPDGGRFSFSHDKVREALYGKMEAGDRRRLHLHVALALEESVGQDVEQSYALAHHFCQSDNLEKAVQYSMQAGDLALERHAHREALEYFEQARVRLAQMDPLWGIALRQHWHEAVGDAACMMGNYVRAIECFKAFLSQEAQSVDLVRVHTKMGQALLAKSEALQAIPVLQKALALMGERVPGNPISLIFHLLKETGVYVWHNIFPPRAPAKEDSQLQLIGRLYNQLSRTYFFNGHLVVALWIHFRHLNISESHNVLSEKAQAYCNHATVCADVGFFSRGLRYARKSLAIRQDLGDRWGAAQSRNSLILSLFPLGRWEDILHEGQLAEAEFEQLGDKWELAITLVLVSVIYSFIGDWDQSEAFASRAYRLGKDTKQVAAMAYALRTKAELGDRFPQQELLSEIEELIPSCKSAGQPLALFQLYCSKGLVLRRCGRYREAELAFREAIGYRERYRMRFEATVNIYTDCAEAVILQAEHAETRSERERYLGRAARLLRSSAWASRPYVNQYPRYLNARARYNWLMGRHRKAEKIWLKAHSLFLKKGSVWGQALVLMDWATALHPGNPNQARPLLKTAWPLLMRLGSKSDLERLRQMLPEAGSTPLATTVSRSFSTQISQASHGEWVGAERLATLAEMSSKMSSTLDLNQLLDEVVAAAAHIFGAERAFLYLIHPESGELVRKAAFVPVDEQDRERPFSESVLADVMKKGAGVLSADAQGDSGLAASESVTTEGILSLMCAPMNFQGRALGALYLDNRLVKGLFAATDLTLLEAFASQAAVALENARLFSSQENARKDISLLYETSKELIGVMDRRQICASLLARARALTGASAGAVALIEGGQVDMRVHQHVSPQSLKEIQDYLSQNTVEEVKPLSLSDGIVARLTPLMTQGKVEGALVVIGGRNPERTDALLSHIAAQGSLALNNSRLYELAITDELTLLYQRRYYEMVLKDLIERKKPFGLILIDLNDFKIINDTRGHAVGDAVLKRVGQEMRKNLRGVDLPARIGGDEFAVVLPGESAATTELVVEKLRKAFAAIVIEEPGMPPPKVWASFGYAVSDEGPIERVKVMADERLYEDKKRSKSGRVTHPPISPAGH